jgi:hypothetical protein
MFTPKPKQAHTDARFIRLLKPVKRKNDTILYCLDFSKDLHEYLFSNHFYVKYGRSVRDLEDGVLNIPGVGCMLTFALITGANLIVEELDENFFRSLKFFEKVLTKFYPDLHFTGKLTVNTPVSINKKNHKCAVMFSGGVDSTHLYTKMRNLKPELYTIIGGTIPVTNKKLIHRFKANIEHFSEKEGVNRSFIETNIGQVLNEGLLTAKYGTNFPQPEPTWWGKINHGLIPLTVCAPLTFMDNVANLYMSTFSDIYPDGAHPIILDTIFWNGTRVISDIDDKKRFDKIKEICKTYTPKDPTLPKLQICNYATVYSNLLNCGSCDKCLASIVSLIVLGLDPRRHGFPIIENVYNRLEKQAVPKTYTPHEWERIQEEVHKNKCKFVNSSKHFFRWFKEFQFKPVSKERLLGQRIKCSVMRATTRLPKYVQDNIMEKYYQFKYIKKISSTEINDIPHYKN